MSYDSHTERRFFEDHLSGLLGPGVALVEAQRSLASMLPELESRRFHGQRVDFALETPDDLKIVFEIDGPTHWGADGPQASLDRERTRALERAGWIVERISVRKIGHDRDVFRDVVKTRVAQDPTLETLRRRASERDEQRGEQELAFRCAIAPHAVARVQLAVLLALLHGELSLGDDQWRIGVIERDLPCAEIAIVDLLEQVTQLCALYGIEAHPQVQLLVVPAYVAEAVGTSRTLAWVSVEIRYIESTEIFDHISELDLLIDVSVRTRPRDIRLNEPLPTHHLRGMVPFYEIRTAYRRVPEAFIDWPAPRPVPDPEVIEEPLRYFLQAIFRRPNFLEKQLDVMKRAMLRKDVLGLLPTGGGKSLTFQLPTLLSPGVTLIVAPLKSLIDDQMDNLHRAGINRVGGIHSGFGKERKEQAIREIVSGYPRFVYISPERLHIKSFREDLRASPISRSLAFSVVDEAHCVSEWGHDFRPSYLSVAHQARSLFDVGTGAPPIIALTATASNTVLTDVIRELQFDAEDREALVSVTTFDRRELQFIPVIGTPETKRKDLEEVLGRVATTLGCETESLLDDFERAGIVFCRYVNGSFGVMGVSTHLQSLNGWGDGRVQIYSGGRPKKWSGTDDWEIHKRRVQRRFKDSTFPILIATSSFGMGIDKENIRYTIHYGIPHSLEALAQEAGRAGRDKNAAACAIVYTDEALDEQTNYLAADLTTETARKRAQAISRKEQGDASRIMFLLGTSYPGVDKEASTLTAVFDSIRMAWDRSDVAVGSTHTQTLKRPYGDPASGQFDKALYRLTALGVVTDYTIDYAARAVEIETIRIDPDGMERNLRAFVRRYGAEEAVGEAINAAREAVDPSDPFAYLLRAICVFAYSVIETARRESLRNVVTALRDCNGDGQALARRLNEFLSNNTFTARVAEITRDIIEDDWFALAKEAHNLELAIQLVNAADRELESNPTHAGLHLLSGLGSVQRDTVSPRAIAERIVASLNYYETTFGKSPGERLQLARDIVQYISSTRRDRLDALVATLLALRDNDDIARAAYPYVVQPDLKRRCAVPWLKDVRNRASGMRTDLVGAKQ